MQYGLPIVIIVANNGMYGTIRMHQERRYPGRVVGTTLVNPDFVALARSFGARGRAGGGDAKLSCRRCGGPWRPSGPALIELRTDPEAISVRRTLSQIRSKTELRRAAVATALPNS